MPTIIALPGSLRKGSFNRALLNAASRAAPPGCRLEITGLEGIPLYDADLEAAEGIPPAVQALKDRIASADGLLLATPEYNASLPGVFKNAIDWLSRPPADIPRVFGNRPVGLIGASAGGFGTILSQTAWLPVLRALRARVYFGPPIRIARAGNAFDAAGDLKDDDQAKQLAEFLSGFVGFIDHGSGKG
jgi:chromate reductase, NAD(P)H dehydrogenase (quinone)